MHFGGALPTAVFAVGRALSDELAGESGSGPSSPPPPPDYPPAPPSPPPTTDMKLSLAWLAVISVACGVLSLFLVIWNHRILRKKAAEDPVYKMHRHGRSTSRVTTPFRSATRARGPRLRPVGTAEPTAYGTPAHEARWMVQPYSPYFLSDDAVVKQLQAEAKKDGSGQPHQKAIASHQAAMRFQKSIRKTFHAALLADRLTHARASAEGASSKSAAACMQSTGDPSPMMRDDTSPGGSPEPQPPEPQPPEPQPPELDTLEA